MLDSRVASRYAKSLIQLAIEKGVLENIKADMDLFSSVCKENHDFVALLKSPIISYDKKLSILKAIFGGKVNDMTSMFFDIITRKGREAHMPDIAAAVKSQYQEIKGIVSAKVTTPFPLTDDLRASFNEMVAKTQGKQVDLTELVDDSLIGGFVLQVGDKQIDESVKSKLNTLKNKFRDNTYIAKY